MIPGGSSPPRADRAARRALLAACAIVWALSSCSSTATPGTALGLEVVTPAIGVPSGGRAAVLLRSRLPARVAIVVDGEVLGTGRSGSGVTSLRFLAPPSSFAGSLSVAQVTAMAEGGLVEMVEVTLVGLGRVETSTSATEVPRGVAALGSAGVIMTDRELWLARRSQGVTARTTPPAPFTTITADDSAGAVLLAGAGNSITVYEIASSILVRGEVFTLPNYDNSPEPPEVQRVNAIHVSGDLIATANERGMSIVDRSQGYGWGETYCRARSSMTSKLQPGSFERTMAAVVVLADERAFAGGAYLNINEAHGSDDDGTCRNPFPGRGTRPIAPPEEDDQAWDTAAIVLTPEHLWIGRRDQGIVRVPVAFAQEDILRLPRDDLWLLGADHLPLPRIADLDPCSGEQVLALVHDTESVLGGLALVDSEGTALWIDMASLGGLPVAADTTPSSSVVWVATSNGYAVFDLVL